MATVNYFGPGLLLIKVEGGVQYLMERHKEPTIFPAFLAMDRMYGFYLRSGLGLSPDRHTKQGF